MMHSLNYNQKRRLLSTVKYVDNLLGDALRVLSSAENPSPFQSYLPDSLPVQRKVIGDYLNRLRGMLVRILEDQSIEIPRPDISSLWFFRNALIFAEIAIEELGPKYLRGYGDVPDDTAHELDVLTTQIKDILGRMSKYLAQDAGRNLQALLSRMEKTTDEVRRAGMLEEVITEHGLVELRPALEALIERVESGNFEIALFGRVSSGKSSLLNYLLRTDVLPVGVTPVTAIPTRILLGPQPVARIWFAQAGPIVVQLHELNQYVTEQGNPGNARQVTRIQVELPSDRLHDGVTFVDTPGLGSLARSGALETMAYLPRCDLGIVLIDSSSALIEEDIAIVNGLYQVGAEVMALLTKADLLTTHERDIAVQYIREQLRADTGYDVPVYQVSVKGSEGELCDQWFEKALVPCLREHQRLAQTSLRRKVGLLQEATIAALRRRVDKKSIAYQDIGRRWPAVESALNEALAMLESAMRKRLEYPDLADDILNSAVRDIADIWQGGDTQLIDAKAVVISCASSHIGNAAAGIAASLASIRKNLIDVLQSAAAAAGKQQECDADIPAPCGLPIPDLTVQLPGLPLRWPRFAFFSKQMMRRSIRRQLLAQLDSKLASLTAQHVRQLSQWRLEALAEMRRSFTAKADLYRACCGQISSRSDTAALERALKSLTAAETMSQQ